MAIRHTESVGLGRGDQLLTKPFSFSHCVGNRPTVLGGPRVGGWPPGRRGLSPQPLMKKKKKKRKRD